MKFLFIGPSESTFAKNDIEILLSCGAEVEIKNSSIGKGLKGGLKLAGIWFGSIYKALTSDAIFCWFADYADLFGAFFGRLFGKKVFVIAGGFDVSNFPEFNSGAVLNPFRWFCAKNSFKLATKIFPVSRNAYEELIKLVPEVSGKCEVIYNCIDFDKLRFFSVEKERKIVLTVSRASVASDYHLKGLPKFFELAKLLPEFEFVCAGLNGEALELAEKAVDSDNVVIIPGPLGFVEEIVPLYYSSAVYLQPSFYESFSVAVAEATACGCVPVVGNGGALPETVVDPKYVARSTEDYIRLIREGFYAGDDERARLSNLAEKYDVKYRREHLLRAMGLIEA